MASNLGLRFLWRIPTICLLLIVGILPFSLASRLHAEEHGCASLTDWLDTRGKKGSSMLERQAIDKREYQARKDVSVKLFEGYLEGQLDLDRIMDCIGSFPDRDNFLGTFHETIFYRGLKKLRSGRGKKFVILNQLIDQRIQERKLGIFRMTGHKLSNSPAPFKAGFGHTLRSIYTDMDKITPDTWYIKFLHEILHGLDDQIFEGARVYGKPGRLQYFKSLEKQTSDPDQLPPNIQAELTQWIQAGLSFGLWAEYRAALLTHFLYQDGVEEGLWKPNQAMDDFAGKAGEENFARYLYNSLDDNAENDNAIFKEGLLKNALDKTRRDFRNSKSLPNLGNLEPISKPIS